MPVRITVSKNTRRARRRAKKARAMIATKIAEHAQIHVPEWRPMTDLHQHMERLSNV